MLYCIYKRKGCTWTGELKILDSHLKDDTTTGYQYCEETCLLCAEKIPCGLQLALVRPAFHLLTFSVRMSLSVPVLAHLCAALSVFYVGLVYSAPNI